MELEIIEKLKEDKEYQECLIKAEQDGKKYINISFSKLLQIDPILCDMYLDNPTDFTNNLQAISNTKIEEITITNPKGIEKIKINQIRQQHIKQLISIEGVIKRRGTIQPKISVIKYECPSCGNIINIIIQGEEIKEPMKCGCGRKGYFRVLEETHTNYQSLLIEEITDHKQPENIPMELSGEYLTNEKLQERITPGTRVTIQCIVSYKETERNNKKLSLRKFKGKIIDIQPTEEDIWDIKLGKEVKDKLKKISKKKDVLIELSKIIAPTIYGMEDIKQALLLQSVSGVKKEYSLKDTRRPTINILIIGDPGIAKSKLGTSLLKIVPRSQYISGRGASGVGMTASVIRDELTGQYMLEAGAIVLANHSTLIVDEADKMHKDDIANMHEAMSLNTISINKAGINATLKAETSVLALANPKLGRFDMMQPLADQINMEPPFLNRFDLIFTLSDKVDEKKDEALANFIFEKMTEEHKDDDKQNKTLREYITYARQLKPKITKKAYELIKQFFINLRKKGSQHKTISITGRQIEGIVRLAEANAKIRLSNTVNEQDSARAIKMTYECLKNLGFDEDTGVIDIDLISTSIKQSKKGKCTQILKTITEEIKNTGNRKQEINYLKEKTKLDQTDFDDAITILKKEGYIFESPNGYIQELK